MPNAHHERPYRVDIYADGSFLKTTHAQRPAAAGWGAVIIESFADRQETWALTDRVVGKRITSSSVEIVAALEALRALRLREDMRPGLPEGKPHIILHTDQKEWIAYIEQVRQNPKIRYKGTAQSKIRLELAREVISMDVTVEYVSHQKEGATARTTDDPQMNYVHRLALRAAVKQRKGGQEL